jgi:hypothetical protein
MRLLLIQGDQCAIYEGRKQLAVYVGASGLDPETAEQTRLAKLVPKPIPQENKNEPHST